MNKAVKLSARIPPEQAGQRLDQALAALFREHSRARLQGWIRAGRVLVDDRVVNQKHRIAGGELVCIDAEHEVQDDWQAEDIPLDIVHEDEHILVINKPAGLVVHPGAGNARHTLLNALLHHQPELAQVPRAGIVHRLDKDTTGLMVIARTPEAHTRLVTELQARRIHRHYQALVRGELISGGSIDQPIGRHPTRRIHMAVRLSGKPACTHYRIEERFSGFTLLHCQLESGRTHQIRVHMAYLKHPVVGDPLYGGRQALPAGCPEPVQRAIQAFRRQALHACELQLPHPTTAREMAWQTPLPEDFLQLLDILRACG